jgi:hypothetical protein
MNSLSIALPAPGPDIFIPAPILVAGETVQGFVTAKHITRVLVTKELAKKRINAVQLRSLL